MSERVLLFGTLGDLIDKILPIENPKDGSYLLYAPHNTLFLSEAMSCAIMFVLWEEDVTEIGREYELEAVYDISDAQHVIDVALKDKPDASKHDLIEALNYYMDNDAFIDFSSQ